MRSNLLIIAGTSGVGKSTLSARIASSLNFRKIAATDTIREVLRASFTSIERPALHRSSFENAGGSAVEDWKETVYAISEGVSAVIERSMENSESLLLEGVHYVPNGEILDKWNESGGRALGVVLHVSSEERHRGMIAMREKHNGKSVDHYLEKMDRIREIQKEMVVCGEQSGWAIIDATEESNVEEIFSKRLGKNELSL